MKRVIFAGPSLSKDDLCGLEPGFELRGPAAAGDVYRVLQDSPAAIGIIDGYFDHRLSVWHKELLWALSQGVAVYGAASLGALRAAELAGFGMIGVGRVFEQYRAGVLEDDDEVAVVHEPADTGYVPRSEALVNIRATLMSAAEAGALDSETADSFVRLAKQMFYADRSFSALIEHASEAKLGAEAVSALTAWLAEFGVVNQKRLDALAMLERMRKDSTLPRAREVSFRFEYTDAFHVFRTKLNAERTTPKTFAGGGAALGGALERALPEHALSEHSPSALAPSPDDSVLVRCDSLERALALCLAEQAGATATPESVQRMSEEFRRERGLYSEEQTTAWMNAHGLDLQRLSELCYDEVLVRRFREAARQLASCQSSNLQVLGKPARPRGA